MIKENIEREFKRYLETHLKSTTESRLSDLSEEEQQEFLRRENELHPSSFPFCPLRNIYKRLIRELDPVVYSGFRGSYYTSVGHVTHSLLQHHLGIGGKILGNWKCLDCNHVHKMTSHVKSCIKCKSSKLIFREIGGRYGHVHWHKDGMFQTASGDLWLVDYKTSYAQAIFKYNSKGEGLPHNSNVAQIETYVPLAEDRLKVSIKGWILAYFARDYPVSAFAIVVKPLSTKYKARLKEKLDHANQMFGLGLAPDKNISVMVENKICVDRDYYKGHVHTDYDECPLQKVCFNREKLKTQVKTAVQIYRSHHAKK